MLSNQNKISTESHNNTLLINNKNNISNTNNNINIVELPYKKEIYNLKEKIKKLEFENKNNLLKLTEFAKTKKLLSEEILINKNLSEELILKQNLIEKLKTDIIQGAKDKKEEQRLIENKFNKELIYYKRLHNSSIAKENAASSIIKLSETQHNCIMQLENKIEEVKNSYEQKIKELELEHENRYCELERQMMEFLKNSQKNIAKNNEANLELNSKLTIIYKNQMLNELESQSHQIEDLLKEKERQSKEIYMLKQELIVHKKVEEIIKNKNNKYLNFINKLNVKFNQFRNGEEKNDGNNKVQKNKIDIIKENNIMCRSQSVKLLKNFFGNKGHEKKVEKNNNIFQNMLTNKYIDEKEKLSKNISLKDFHTFNNKVSYNNKIYNNLFKDIIILCNKSLEKILKEKEVTEISNSHLFSDNFDYNSLKINKKYELIIEIMKKILSFININNEDDKDFLDLKKKLELIKINDDNNIYSYNSEKQNNTLRTKINNNSKYYKMINFTGINKNWDKLRNEKEFQNNKNKYKEIFNKKIKSKLNSSNEKNKLINSYRGKTPNLIIRYSNVDREKNINDIKNETFFKK